MHHHALPSIDREHILSICADLWADADGDILNKDAVRLLDRARHHQHRVHPRLQRLHVRPMLQLSAACRRAGRRKVCQAGSLCAVAAAPFCAGLGFSFRV